MNKTSVNTFGGGMNKDLDRSILPPNKYIDAQNYRIFTTEGNTTGSLENIRGTKFVLNTLISGVNQLSNGHTYLVVKDSVVYNAVTYVVGSIITANATTDFTGNGYLIDTTNSLVDGYIIGSCQLRDDIILFTTKNTSSNPTGRENCIYKLRFDLNTESQISLTLLYNDNNNTDNSSLKFSTAYPIKAIGKYETPHVQKVYWTDGYNNFRYANLAVNLTVDGEVYSNNNYMAVDKFELLPKITVTKPTLQSIIGGRIKTGMVAYAYQLYIMNGAETTISPMSDPIAVVSDNDYLTNTLTYNGDATSINSGKGFVMRVVNADTGYNRIRLIRVHYEYINSTPEISVAADISISPTGSTIDISDVGDTLYELTVDEFNLLSTEMFVCKDIATKDNRLFVANVKKSEFICDSWDARAVRFISAGNAVVYDGGTPLTIQSNLSNWSSYTIDHDGINQFNNSDHDGDANYKYMYQADGTTIGAEGLNIKIDFETSPVTLDTSNNNYTFYTVAPTDPSDLSYKSYASVWKGGKLSWQRDEVYRLFVVFGNDRGQTADPKWICDLKMPSLHDVDFTNSSSATVKPSALSEVVVNDIVTNRLYPRIYFKSFPTNATWAQVHRVKRDRADRSVVTQGFAVPTKDNGTWGMGPDPNLLASNYATDGKEMIKLISPDININRNISKQANDYIEYVTRFGVVGTTVVPALWPVVNSHKMKSNTRVEFTTNSTSGIKDAFVINPATSEPDYVLIDGKKYINYQQRSKSCTGLLVCYDNPSWTAEGVNNVVVNYRANVFSSQYGGNTYEDRMSNISIPCSDVIKASDVTSWIDISYGDTYINYFDVAVGLADIARADLTSEITNAYIPLESSINCDLRHDSSSLHNTYTNPNSNIRQEYAGKHNVELDLPNKITLNYEQEKDLYLYNTVYSQQIDIKSVVSLVVDKILETDFDCMVKVSNNKSNGEVTDSWTKFAINEFIEVESIYGPINALNVFNDKLFYFQDKAFGVLSVNERSLISDSNSSQLVLGTGGVLDRFDYASTTLGCKDKFSISNGLTGMFWYDRVNNYIIKFADGIDKISLSKGMQSYLNQNVLSTQSVISHPDINNSEILFTFFIGDTGSETNSFTVSYNENFEAFISFYSFIPNIYIPYNNRYLTTTRSKYCGNEFNLNYLFLHDSLIYPRCNFYSVYPYNPLRYFDSTIKVCHNQDYMYTKVWDNLLIGSNVYTDNVELYNQSINSIRCYNDFQNTDYHNLIYKTNLERRERGWITTIPRNAVDTTLTSNPNIFDNGNLNQDISRLYRERLRDKYMTTDIVYNNTVNKDKIVLNNIGTKYRISFR